MDNFFCSFFRDTDGVIVDGRLHIFSPGQDDYIQFHNRKTGLCIGPKLDALDMNWIVAEKETLLDRIKREVLNSQGDANDDALSGDKLLMHVLYDTIEHNSFKHVLEYRIECAKSVKEQGIDPSHVVDRIYKSLDTFFFKKIFSVDSLIIGGDMYCLTETESPKRNFAKIGRRFYQIRDRSQTTIQDILDRRDALVEDEIRERTRADDDISKLVEQSIDKYSDRLGATNDYYNQENNLGFHRHDKDIYVYTKTPSYVLYEKVLKKYYEFPPARIGVKVKFDGSYASIYSPVTLDGYLHPAVSSEKPYSIVCFEHVDIPNFECYSTKDKILTYLFNGCQMLMSLYCSEKGAFNNLYIPKVAEMFRHLEIPVRDLADKVVTNKELAGGG